MDKKELTVQEEAEKLSESVASLVDANDILIHLVTRLINKHNDNSLQTRTDLQRAYLKIKSGKENLRRIGFWELSQ